MPRSSDDESGLVLVEVLDTKQARKVGMQGERIKVPFQRLSRTHRAYYVADEDTKQALKDYLRRLLGDSKNLAVSDEMLAALRQYEEEHFVSPLMRSEALNDVLAEFREKRKQEMDGKYVSFTGTRGKLKGGDKEQIDIIISGPITGAMSHGGAENVKSYRLGLDHIEDVGDGKYKVSFVGAGIGLYNIRVVMFGKESPLSPFQFMMKASGGEWLQSDGKGKNTAM